MTKITDNDNNENGEQFDISKSQTLSNPKISDMNEKTVDEIKSDIDPEVRDNFNDDKKISEYGTRSSFLGGLKTGFIDTAIMLVVSGILLCITGVILLYIFGYYITNVLGILFIVLVIVSILYPTFKNSYRFRKLKKIKKI